MGLVAGGKGVVVIPKKSFQMPIFQAISSHDHLECSKTP